MVLWSELFQMKQQNETLLLTYFIIKIKQSKQCVSDGGMKQLFNLQDLIVSSFSKELFFQFQALWLL